MSKEIIFSSKARQKILDGIDKLANIVKVTLGPKGRNIILEKDFGSPLITKDGVTVASSIELEDKYENIGAQLVKEVAEKTSDIAGDGTTTATLLAQTIYKEGLKAIGSGVDPIAVKRGIDKAVKEITKKLKEKSKVIKDKKEIEQVGLIASNNDVMIGRLIADAMEKVGRDGVITIEEAKSMDTNLDIVEGMQFNNGYLSPYFITNQDNLEVVLDNPYILIYENKITNINDLLNLLGTISKANKSVLIIAENVDGEALKALVINKLRGTLNCCAIKAPGFGDRRKVSMEDIGILTGGRFISNDLGMALKDIKIEYLGVARKIIIDKEKTTIIEGQGNTKELEERIKSIRSQLEKDDSKFNKERLQERLAKLAGGIAVINLGATTETEMKEKKARAEDALNATKAAVEEGIISGGGIALLECIGSINIETSGDEKVGVDIIKKALEEPLRQIVKNAGLEDSVVVNKIKESESSIGYDVLTDEYVNMIEKGIIDPTKVTRTAIENSASIAGLLLITEGIVINKPEDKKKEDINA